MKQSIEGDHPPIFFCFGPPKSGTTFLQRTLNIHREISCPSEHKLKFLQNGLRQMLGNYNGKLTLWDKHTGGQGPTLLRTSTLEEIFRHSVLTISYAAAAEKKIAGINDNAVIHNLDKYQRLFSGPKMIAIFRDPANTAISSWHHNNRLADEEDNSGYRDHMLKYGGFTEWVRKTTEWWVRDINLCRDFTDRHSNLIMIRYEDLVQDKRRTLITIFNFLGANTDDEILNMVQDQSSFDKMRENSSNPGFFRRGSVDTENPEVSEELRQEIISIAGIELEAMNYPVGN